MTLPVRMMLRIILYTCKQKKYFSFKTDNVYNDSIWVNVAVKLYITWGISTKLISHIKTPSEPLRIGVKRCWHVEL